MNMDVQEENDRFASPRAMPIRNMSSSSSLVFFSANQSPFFSPRSSTCQLSESLRYDFTSDSINLNIDHPSSSSGVPESLYLATVKSTLPDMSATPAAFNFGDSHTMGRITTSTGVSNSTASTYSENHDNNHSRYPERQINGRRRKVSSSAVSVSLPFNRLRSCNVFIGLYGHKPSLLRFADWLCAELEVQGISCFVSDRSRCRNSRKHAIVERAMDVSSFGIVIITRKSFKNPYTIEELRFFSGKKNLVPIFFDLSPSDCLIRDIIERRGELWEKHGGALWNLYGGVEKEWKEAIYGLSRVDECKLEAQDGNWRDCIFRGVTLLATKLGRRSISERLTKWRERVEKEEFPFPRNNNFVGRKKELLELEFILFGNVTGDSERDYFELKARSQRKNFTIGSGKNGVLEERQSQNGSSKNIEPVVWKESEKEIEMKSTEFSHRQILGPKSGGGYHRRKRTTKTLYGKGIGCVTGEPGIGKTELLLEFAYRYHQRYKMVLWVGGESRYIRQNYLNMWSFLEVDVGVENRSEKSRIKRFEEQEEVAISRVRKELMRNIPYLLIIDNLESEKDWWDRKLVMDLLPRYGGETHIIISTRLPRIMNLEPLKLSYLSGVEAMSLMQGGINDYPVEEVDALRVIEERAGRSTLALAIIGAILAELPITPIRLLDTINRMPLKEISGKRALPLWHNTFLLQLFEVCFSIFDHADGPRSLASRMVQVSGWFAPSAIPVSMLAFAANSMPEKYKGTRLWRKILRSLTCGFTSSYTKKSELEASSMLFRFNIARSCTRPGCIQFNELIKLYVRKRGVTRVTEAMVQAVISRGTIYQHSEHMWATCFLLFGFGHDPVVVELKPSDLLYFVKGVVLPLAIQTFITFSRCSAALELLRLCTNALEAADQTFVTPVEKWLDKSLCCRPIQTNAQLSPCLWQELALCRATVLETRAKLMLRGGQFDIGDDLIRKTVFIRTSICGENHPDTMSARETLSKIGRLLANFQIHNSS